MAARPPTGGNEEPEAIEFGIAALDARLDDASVEFPATGAEIVDALDDPEIAYDASGHTIQLADAVDQVPTESFESRTELLDQLYPVFDQQRRHSRVPLLTRVRELLPF